MNDRFLSRGKLKADNLPHKKGDWVFGHFVILKDGNRDIPFIYGFGEIIPETLGSCTGLNDKNGMKIFEGDIIRYTDNKRCYSAICVIRWDIKEARFAAYGLGIDDFPIGDFVSYDPQKFEVIGNIHDNKQMLGRADMPVSNDVFQPVFQPVLKSATPENFELMQG